MKQRPTIRPSTKNDISPYGWNIMRVVTKLKVIHFINAEKTRNNNKLSNYLP